MDSKIPYCRANHWHWIGILFADAPLQSIASMYLIESASEPVQMVGPMLQSVSSPIGAFVALVLVVWFIRRAQQSNKVLLMAPNWVVAIHH